MGLAETSQQPISLTTWLKVTPHCNHCYMHPNILSHTRKKQQQKRAHACLNPQCEFTSGCTASALMVASRQGGSQVHIWRGKTHKKLGLTHLAAVQLVLLHCAQLKKGTQIRASRTLQLCSLCCCGVLRHHSSSKVRGG